MLSAAIIGLFCMSQVSMAMKKEIKTSLSSKEEAELRRAVMDYKKNKSRSAQEPIINKYVKKYPNDSLVKAKMNELARFKYPAPPAPVQPAPMPEVAPIKQMHFKNLANRVRMQQASSQELALFVRESKKIINNMEDSEKQAELTMLVDRISDESATQKQIIDFTRAIIQEMGEDEA
jgi:hypothetical protein